MYNDEKIIFPTLLALIVSLSIIHNTIGVSAQENDPIRLPPEMDLINTGQYYQASNCEPKTWYEAKLLAESMSFHGVQGHLVVITHFYEHWFCNDLRHIAYGYEGTCWIGLRRNSNSLPWYWVTGEPYTFSFWWQDEGELSEVGEYEDLFARMRDWPPFLDNGEGYWESTGNGQLVYSDGFIVEYPNPPPIADAGPDQSVLKDALVTLDGTGSSDPDLDYPLTYSWEISSTPTGSVAALDDPSSPTPSFTSDIPGTYVITLVVTDSYGASGDPDQLIVEAYSPGLLVDDILDFYDASVADGTLVGYGPGSSANGKLVALRNMIDVSGDLIEDGLFDKACQQLMNVYRRCDGVFRPPDFVAGTAASELACMILDLIESISV